MRMWMVQPKLLCRQHLLGEYSEIAKHRHNFVKKHSIHGRIFPVVLIEPEAMQSRFYELKAEGISRGYNMKANYIQPDLSHLSDEMRFAKVDVQQSVEELCRRCPECRKRLEQSQ